MAVQNRKPQFTGELAWASNMATMGEPFHVAQLQASVLSSEHGFNALKTLDKAEQSHVLSAPTPKEAKRRGRTVTLRPGWDEGLRVAAMAHVLEAKFNVAYYRERLLATEGQRLVETNFWHDQFWGSCYCGRHASEGLNMLGELLMALRTQMKGL